MKSQTASEYSEIIILCKELFKKKAIDYGSAWREMRDSSMTDTRLMKWHRVQQIVDKEKKAFLPEGMGANYWDNINYAVFYLTKLTEKKHG